MTLTIGFIGTGIMGKPMAANLLRAGYRVQAYNRTASKLEELISMGAEACATPAQASAGADLMISIVSRTEDVQEVLLGSEGAIQNAAPGTIVIDMSTIDVGVTRLIAENFAGKGIDYIDAPVSGGEKGAIAAALTIFVGGNTEAYERALPVLSAMGTTITYMGGSGAGQAAKACNQILVSVGVMATAEALNYGLSEGLDMKTLIEAASGGSAQSWILENLGTAMADSDFAPGFMIDLMQKDLRMLIENGNSKDIPIPTAELASEMFHKLQQQGIGSEGMQAMFKAYSTNKEGC